MKKLYTLGIVILLAGCSMLAPDFDNNEYAYFVDINTHAEYLKSECGGDVTGRLEHMKFKSARLLTYSSHFENNEEITAVATIIDNDIAELIGRNKNGFSKTYCELKADQLLIKLDRILDAIGNLR